MKNNNQQKSDNVCERRERMDELTMAFEDRWGADFQGVV